MNISKAQNKYVNDYAARMEKGFKSFHLRVGDMVLRKNVLKIGRKGSRLEADWLGPYEVKAVHPQGTVSLAKDGHVLKNNINCRHLKPYFKSRYVCVILLTPYAEY